MDNTKSKTWSIQGIWNELVTEERKMEPREYVRGSEIGRSFLERYLKMKGVPFTNHFDSRILRVFDVGHIFEEDVMLRIFNLLGLVIGTQDEVRVEIPGLLPMVGHHDPRLGGKIDLEKVKENVNQPGVTEWMRARTLVLAEKLAKEYPNGLEDIITEMKTINSRAFWAHKNMDPETGFFKGYPHHRLQCWGYLKGKNHPRGRLFYMSKDDLTLFETPVLLNDTKLEEEWMADIHGMTMVWEKGKEMKKVGQDMPVLGEDGKYHLPAWLQEMVPENIVYNEDKEKWELNWEIGRSNYLTLWTGFETTDAWEKANLKELRNKNRGECKDCKKEFSFATLKKYDGLCGRCHKKGEK